MKKIFSVIVALTILASVLALSAFAARKENVTVAYGTPVSSNTAIDTKWDSVTSVIPLVWSWANDNAAPTIKVMFDKSNLYFLFETSFTEFNTGANKVNNFQILLSGIETHVGQCADITLSFEGTVISGGITEGVTVKRVNSANKTAIEITAPWTSVAPTLTVAKGAVVYVEAFAMINDNQFTFSQNEDEAWGSYLFCSTGTDTFGTLTLGEIDEQGSSAETADGLMIGAAALVVAASAGICLMGKRH